MFDFYGVRFDIVIFCKEIGMKILFVYIVNVKIGIMYF